MPLILKKLGDKITVQYRVNTARGSIAVALKTVDANDKDAIRAAALEVVETYKKQRVS